MLAGRSFGGGPLPMGGSCSAVEMLILHWTTAGSGWAVPRVELASGAQHVSSLLHHFVFVWVLVVVLVFSELE